MSNSISKFSKFFIAMLIPLSLIMFVGMFFSMAIVGTTYFIAMILAVVFFILSKSRKKFITNYRLAFMFFEIINLIAVIAVIYYEFEKHTLILNMFLVALILAELSLLALDVFYIKNEKINPTENFFISLVKLASFICLLTYFFKVSTLFFAIDALIFEITNIILKILFMKIEVDDFVVKSEKEEKETSKIEQIIDSAAENEGDIE